MIITRIEYDNGSNLSIFCEPTTKERKKGKIGGQYYFFGGKVIEYKDTIQEMISSKPETLEDAFKYLYHKLNNPITLSEPVEVNKKQTSIKYFIIWSAILIIIMCCYLYYQ